MIALCHDCRHQHKVSLENLATDWLDWQVRHRNHRLDLIESHEWLESIANYKHNADVKIAYGASQTITISPENVASSSTFVAGVESAVIDNTSNKYVDAMVGGLWTCGATPTANTQVLIYVGAVRDDAPTYPDVFDGTASAETLTSVGVGQGFLKLGAVINVDSNTSNRGYDVNFSVAQLFGGIMPPKWFLFITHNTGVNSHSTAGNHIWKYTPIYYTVV
jgi:hypothetical protein